MTLTLTHLLTRLPVEHIAHYSKPAWRHACALVLVSMITKCVFIPTPTPTHYCSFCLDFCCPACVALFLSCLWTSLSCAWGLFPLCSTHSELWDSPKSCPEEVDWSFCVYPNGSCGSVASAKEDYLQLHGICLGSVYISHYAMIYAVFSSSGKKGQDSTSLPWDDGWSSLRKEVASIWNVGLTKAEETPSMSPSFSVSLLCSGALDSGLGEWRHTIWPSALSQTLIHLTHVSPPDSKQGVSNPVVLLISTSVSFTVYHQCQQPCLRHNR